MVIQFSDHEMKKAPKKLKLVIFLFFIMAGALLACVLVGLISKLLHWGIDGFLSNKIIVLSITIAAALLLCAMRLHTGQRWVWIASLAINMMLVGSLLFIPLVVINLVILLKRDTRQFFKCSC